MSDKTAPERIWLQTAGSYAEAHEATIGTDTSVTWCDMQQDEGDQEYIRADLGSFYKESDIDALMDERDRLRVALRRAETALQPFADCVFYDNGDCTVSPLTHVSEAQAFTDAYFAYRGVRAILTREPKR